MPDTDFREKMRFSESSGDHTKLTTLKDGRKMFGAYQFSAPRLKDYKDDTGEDFSEEDFLSDMSLQDKVMDWHERDVIDYAMDRGLDQYIGKDIAGVPIDMPAMIAMAHIGGRKGMRDFIQSDGKSDASDQFKTRISDYGKKFSGVDPYSLTPMRPQARPQGLLDMSPRPKMRPQPQPQGLLNVMPTAPTQRMRPRNSGSLI